MREDFKSIRRLRYPLPAVVEPATSICIKVNVPNDIAYLAAFWGQMFALTRWYAWLPDSAHTAKDVAARWQVTYEQAQESECENVLVRTSPVNDCLLQVSYDGGELWETVYNAYGCALKAAADEFGSGSDQPASKSQPGEQPGGANPEPDQCFDLDLTVNADSPTLIPLPINSGWTLTITELKGAWSDNAYPWVWQCPNGKGFFAGICTNIDGPTIGTDPIPSAVHMRLIARLPDGTYASIPIDGTPYVVPAGQPLGNMFLLPNDSALSGNQGSASLHLLACNNHRDLHWTNHQGTGPTQANYGEEVEFISSAGNPAGIWFDTFNVTNVKMQVVSVSGYTTLSGYGYCWNGRDGSNNFFYQDNAANPCNLLSWSASQVFRGIQFQGSTQFHMVVKFIAV